MEKLCEKVDVKNYKYRDMYERFIKETNSGVCVSGTFDVTKIYKLRKKYKFNAMLCYAIMRAAQSIEEFHYNIKEDGLYYYKNVKVNAVVNGKNGELYYVDYKYVDNFLDFIKEYNKNNEYSITNCCHRQEEIGALISTSAIIQYPFDNISLGISDSFWDNFLIWGKYKKQNFKIKLSISLRFHHATIDGQRAALFFNRLQEELDNFKIY